MAINENEVVNISLQPVLDITNMQKELIILEKAITSSEKKIEAMRISSAQAIASKQHALNESQKSAIKERIDALQKGLAIEVGAVNTLTASYNKYLFELQKVTSVEKARNDLGIQAINTKIAKTKEYISLTEALGSKSTKDIVNKPISGYGTFRDTTSSNQGSTSKPISFTSDVYTKRVQKEKEVQAELDALFDKTTKARFDKAISLEEEALKRKIAIRKLDEAEERKSVLDSLANQKKLEQEKERLYQRVNQNMLEAAQLGNNKRTTAAAIARREEILQENISIKEKLKGIKAVEDANKLKNQAILNQDIKYFTYQDDGYKKAMKSMREYYSEQERLSKRSSDKAKVVGDFTSIQQPTYTRTTDMSGRKVYGDFSDISSRNTYKTDPGAIWKNMQADAGKAGDTSAREFSKTFWGAIEGGTTFGHKLATTFQYATAGTAFYALAGSISTMTQSFLDADKAMHMFRGVLELTDSEAQKLQSTVFSIGTTYGGQLKDLNEAALALGRAGIATKDLGTALKSVSQLSLVSGESLGVVTDVMVSWATLYPEKKIGDLGDIIVKVANESKASVADFNTMSTYILTAGQQAGLTAEAVASLAGAFKQIGKGSSTSGTEIRRFFQQLESGSNDVRKAYSNLNINMDQLRENLMQGGEIADSTMIQLFEKLRDVPEKEGQKAIMHIEEVLDKATLKSLLAVANSGKKGLDEFKRILSKAKDESKGASEKAASEVALSYSVAFERIKNTAFQEANVFGTAFTSRLFDSASVGEFDKYIKELTSDTGLLNKTMHNLGVMLGAVIDNIGKLSLLFLMFKANSWLNLGVTVTSAGFINMARSIGFINAGIATLNALIRANPLLMAGTLATGIWAASSAVAEYIDGGRRDPNGSATLQAQNAKRLTAEKIKDSRALTDELARQELAYKNLSKAASNSSGITSTTLKKQADQAKQNIIDIKKALSYSESPIVKPKVPSIGGKTSPKDKELTTGQIESAAKNRTDELLRQAELAEQQYFYEHGITSEVEQKKYHLNTTLGIQKDILANSGFYKNREEDILKKNIEIWKAKLDINELEYQARTNSSRRLEDINAQSLAIGKQSDERKIELSYNDKLTALDREREDLIHKQGTLLEADQIYFQNKLVYLQLITEEERKQLTITRQRAVSEYKKATTRSEEDRKVMTGYDKYSLDLQRAISDEQQKQIELTDDKLNYVEMNFAMEERIALMQKQNTYSTYVGMQIQQEMQSVLNSGLSDFFNIQSEGWLNFEKLGMSVLTSIMNKMLQMQLIEPLAAAGASGIGSLLGSFFSAQGNVVDPNGKIPMYAKGGTFTNSIVSKPTMFAHGGGFGIMGEAGPESIMPLKRSKSGDLGVVAIGANSQPQQVTVQIRNESGEALAVTRSEARTDMSGMVIDIIIDAVARNKKGMRDIIKGGR